jgi:lipopolysaccharide export system permease protein
VFEPLANVEQVLIRPQGRFGRAALRLAMRLAGTRWDLLIDTAGRGAAPFLRSAAARRLRPGRDELPPPRLWLHFEDRALATRYLGRGTPVLAIAPGGTDPDTVWSPERFGQLVNRLTGEEGPLAGHAIAAFGTADERKRARVLFELLPKSRTIDLMGRLSSLQAAACIERCAGFIGPNTALGHLAAAVATPSLLLTPPDDPLPLPKGAHVGHIGPPAGAEVGIGRSPLDALTIEQVYRSFLELLDRRG